ncbi:hypothetical protein P689_12278 [Candidatus Riesia pediculischaeffi PTSU]|uniref:Cytochrome O ubiquinol oxidase subunit IV n=1 Tax=Candidatus Riesia pediculischaeffi PTSU TaxID=1401651 RepID=A0A0C1V653_9ENTR|nr:hypothetical protein P689_12278 [Candidatus Riesia pediculischaeffi PTSU]
MIIVSVLALVIRTIFHFSFFSDSYFSKEKIYKISFLVFVMTIALIFFSGSLWIMYHLKINMLN